MFASRVRALCRCWSPFMTNFAQSVAEHGFDTESCLYQSLHWYLHGSRTALLLHLLVQACAHLPHPLQGMLLSTVFALDGFALVFARLKFGAFRYKPSGRRPTGER